MLLQSQRVDLIEINIRQYPFYLTVEQLSSAFSGLPKKIKTSQSSSDKLDSHFLKKIYYLCQQHQCRLMLTARDGDSGTPDLYQTFFRQYCDILGYSDIFYSPIWVTSSPRGKYPSSPSMNGSYSRWYNIYLLGGRVPPDDSHVLSLISASIVNFLFRNQYCGYLFQRSYCHLLIEQLLPVSISSKDNPIVQLYSTPLSLSKAFFCLLPSVIESTCWCPKFEKSSQTILNIFILSFALSSIISILFVAWVLNEVSS
jgi:hypothetical protein